MSFKIVGCLAHADEIGKAKALSDLIEWRVDLLGIPPHPIPDALFTFKHRTDLLEKSLEMNPLWCDVEAGMDLSRLELLAKQYPKVRWICSYHNFEKTPEDLNRILEGMRHHVFSLYKLALQANSTKDMLRLMLFCRNHSDIVAVSMGEYGRASRVLGPIFGSNFCYAGLKDDPYLGRYSLQMLHAVFRIRSITKQSAIYALIGDPIEQSPGHIFHNLAFSNARAIYVKMRINKEELSDCFPLIKEAKFSGLSVTRPLKEVVGKYLDHLHADPVNTVLFTPESVGFNTDGMGALSALGEPVKGKKIALLGAGGSAKAVAQEAKRRGAEVKMFSRKNFFTFPNYDYDILINTIPEDLSLSLRPNKTVLDIVYAPKNTSLLQKAEKLGCKCVYGTQMFIEQALGQQALWKHYSSASI